MYSKKRCVFSMNQKFFSVMTSIFLICVIISPQIQTKEIVKRSTILRVDGEGDGDFTTIQSALNHAIEGDVINVYSGMYYENIVINMDYITLEGINHELGTGTDTEYPIIVGDSSGDVVTIDAIETSFSGFIIQGSGDDYVDAGIALYKDNNHIFSNGLTANFYGIVLSNCSENTIHSNYIIGNVMDGIFLSNTHENLILGNTIKENGYQGMYLRDTTLNTISENTISLNNRDGIQLRDNCIYNTIKNNIIYSNGFDGIGFVLDDLSHNLIQKNSIYSNGWNGINLLFGHDNQISENDITLNLINGIQIADADDNLIIKNTISENQEEGIRIIWDGSSNNKIYYNNIINDNAFDDGNNQWDNGELGGNYWSYYSGSDEDNDGIGDTPYLIPGDENMDRYPLMKRLTSPSKPQCPSGPTIGSVGKMYAYKTQSTAVNKVQYGWDWDGDLFVDEWTPFYESEQICRINHTWEGNGTFQIRVKAMDNFGFQSEWSDPLTITMPKQQRFLFSFQNFHTHIIKIIQILIDTFTSLI